MSEKVNVLLVDDQPAKLLSYEAILAELGENLIKANSGREALDILLRNEITVVLMDVSMPDLDGFELARIIRQHPRHERIAIIFVSAVHLTDLDRLRGYEAGAVDYVSVPVIPEILRAKVSVFIELDRKRREWEQLHSELERRVAERTAELEATAARQLASDERLRFIAETIPSILWVAEPDGTVTYANPRWAEYCGLPERDLATTWPEAVLHPQDRERFVALRERHLRDGRAWEVQARLRRHDGCYRWFVTRVVPRVSADRTVLGWFGITTDIHGQVELSEKLRDADRRKDEFLALLAHELRNPLAPLQNAVEILRLGRDDEKELGWCRSVIERQVQQLTRLVDDLLDVSRITRGKIKLKFEQVDLTSIMTGAIETSRPLIDARRHRLDVRLPQHPIWLRGDRVRLTQVLANLLNNAAKYQNEGGCIDFTVERVDDTAVIKVRDQGVGIAPDQLPTVFELFSQVESTLDRAQGGLGIGLSLVRSIIEMHGGSVEATSEGIGRGSEFTIRLQCATGPAPDCDTRCAPAAVVDRPLRILIVDDNTDGAESLAVLLRARGHTVRLAHDGPSALELARTYAPDVILLDIGLPGMDGYEVCRQLRRENSTATIVAITGYGQNRDRQLAGEAGFDGHMIKPVEIEKLFALLASSRGRSLVGDEAVRTG